MKSAALAAFLLVGICSAVQAKTLNFTVAGDVSFKASDDFYDALLGSGKSVMFSRWADPRLPAYAYYSKKSGVSVSNSLEFTHQSLASVDLLVLAQFPEMLEDFTYNETNAIRSFHANGGRVLLMLESAQYIPPLYQNTIYHRYTDDYNSLLKSLGSNIRYVGERILDGTQPVPVANVGNFNSDMQVTGRAYHELSGGISLAQDSSGRTFIAHEISSTPLPGGLPLMMGGALIFFGLKRRTRR